MEAWEGSLPTIMAATKSDAQQGEYYGTDGPGEMGGFPTLALIDDAGRDNNVAHRLWREAEEHTGIVFP